MNVPPRAIARPTLIAFGLVLVLFAGYEVVERTWLLGSDPEVIYLLHRIRGATAALTAGALASWLILRRVPPLLATPSPVEPIRTPRSDPAEKRLHFARWFVLMRWIAVVVAAVLILASIRIFHVLPASSAGMLASAVAVLAVTNLGYALHLRGGRASAGFLRLQLYTDVAILVLLLHLSGGLENPLTPLALLHVIIAGIVLDRRQSYLIALAASGLFAFVAWSEWAGLLPHYPLALFPHGGPEGELSSLVYDPLYVLTRVSLQTATLFLVAFFTTSLTERIRRDELRLERFADQTLAQAQLLQRALETTDTAICVHDRQLETYWSNDRWKAWLDEVPELSGSGGSSRPRASTLEDGRTRIDEVAIPATGEADVQDTFGIGRVFQLVTAPLLDREERISHVVTLARDVTEQKVAQAGLVHSARMVALGELAGQVAHEVNNPIAILSAKARLLLRDGRDDMSEAAAAEIVKIVGLADRVARVAQGLLSFCRPVQGVRTPLDIRVPVREVLGQVDSRAAELGVRVLDHLPPALPPVLANGDELEQVFLNLVINALDAMPNGGELRVCGRHEGVALASGATAVEVLVEDTGNGIPPHLRTRVFEPFLTTKNGTHGSGLGLSICLGVVRSFGGEIEMESEPGRFTRFFVRLPLAPAGITHSTQPAPPLPEPELSHG